MPPQLSTPSRPIANPVPITPGLNAGKRSRPRRLQTARPGSLPPRPIPSSASLRPRGSFGRQLQLPPTTSTPIFKSRPGSSPPTPTPSSASLQPPGSFDRQLQLLPTISAPTCNVHRTATSSQPFRPLAFPAPIPSMAGPKSNPPLQLQRAGLQLQGRLLLVAKAG